ncbi:hypothetical protein DSO57_1015808 [Entomophthora muscae]|uniref:Uncharacterized protein n=1 Tax=Entomophthora muscae TaxID=34485 RepID=A0ACC2U2W0_9FUNG|nr:hypothetical protein DSO57_1015808 [Entomophthora muscae]
MTPPLTPRPDCPLEPTAVAETTSTQLFGVLYITLTGLVDSVVLNSGPWSLPGRSVSYIIKLAPILWWALPAGSAAPHPEPPNASTYDWLPDNGLNAYFLQLSLVSSLWSPLRAAVPVIHWAASWWFISPGWEPNLVSLASLSHNFCLIVAVQS